MLAAWPWLSPGQRASWRRSASWSAGESWLAAAPSLLRAPARERASGWSRPRRAKGGGSASIICLLGTQHPALRGRGARGCPRRAHPTPGTCACRTCRPSSATSPRRWSGGWRHRRWRATAARRGSASTATVCDLTFARRQARRRRALATDHRRGRGIAPSPTGRSLQLLFGYRSYADLSHAFADVSADHDARALLQALFPPAPSDVWALG